MGQLMSWMTGFGLAAGSGGKAFIPLLVLGAFHYTPYFELSDRFVWIASPAVMVTLGVMALAEILVDSVPELGGYADEVAYLPKIAAGFLGFAAATGTVDENLAKLALSGVLGGGTAAVVHWIRSGYRRPFREIAENAHSGFAKLASLGEAGASTVFSAGAIVLPPITLLFGLLAALVALVGIRFFRPKKRGCPHCGFLLDPEAIVCPSCRRDIPGAQFAREKDASGRRSAGD